MAEQEASEILVTLLQMLAIRDLRDPVRADPEGVPPPGVPFDRAW